MQSNQVRSPAATGAPRLTPKGAATRARILDVTADLILKHGVAGVGLDDVRRAAGISGSQLTHYFCDRATLISEVISRQADTVVEQHTAPGLNGLCSIEDFRVWADMILANQRSRSFVGGCNFGSLAGQLVESGEPTRADLAAGMQRWLNVFRGGLLAMKDSGALQADANIDDLASTLLAAMQGGVLLSQTLRDEAPLRASLHAALQTLEHACAGS